jgi:hypothetical protein
MYGMYGMLNGTAVELVEFIDATPINTPMPSLCVEDTWPTWL